MSHPPVPIRVSASLGSFVMLAAIAGGCSSYSSPVLNVSKVEPHERTSDGCSMVFTLDARNDNEDPLPLREVEYRLALNGQNVFEGTRSGEATLRRLGTQQITLPAAFPITPETQALATGRSRYTLSGTMYYVTPGRLAETLFDAGVRKPSVSFSFDGDVDLSGAPFVAQTAPPVPTGTPAAAGPASAAPGDQAAPAPEAPGK